MRVLGVIRTQLVVLGLSLLACEGVLQLLAPFTPVGDLLTANPASRSLMIPDDRRGGRGNPRFPGHDARGYRNPQALARADVVALGDSHTYGTSVTGPEAWPSVLAMRTGLSVYNMALSGYGPGQTELQLPEALALRPRAIVVGFYFGNDLADAYMLARGKPAPPGLDDLVQRADALEREQPFGTKAAVFFRRGRANQPVRRWLGEHVMLYALARELRNWMAGPPPLLSRSFERAVVALASAERAYASVVDGPVWRTILTAPYRRLVLDQRDPRMLLGFERSAGVLESIAASCRGAEVDLLVVLLPTKESVFWPRVAAPEVHPQLREVVLDEAAVRARLVHRLERARVDVLDVLPALRSAAAQPYFENADGHPSPAGHVVIAERVAGWALEQASRRGPARGAAQLPSRER